MVSDSTIEEMMQRYMVNLSASAAGSGVGGVGVVSGNSPEDAQRLAVGGVGGAEGMWLVDSTLLPYTPENNHKHWDK